MMSLAGWCLTDHLKTNMGDTIYNGADDNASGTRFLTLRNFPVKRCSAVLRRIPTEELGLAEQANPNRHRRCCFDGKLRHDRKKSRQAHRDNR